MRAKTLAVLSFAAVLAALLINPAGPDRVQAGEVTLVYKVLAPITRGNLTIFPVVADRTHDTRGFLTLDEGVRSGEVVVTEAGSVQPLVRGPVHYHPGEGAQVNQLVLVNNSDRPLILLAGEIVTGGKQDRVVGKDRIVAPRSEPIDLAVFCVEPGRWVASKQNFGSFNSQMAQPSVRKSAMADQNQEKVWSEVHESARSLAAQASPGAAGAIGGTSSYAGVMSNDEVKQRVESVAAPIEQSYLGLMRELRERNAVGVVVAVNDHIIWADLFASTSLLEKYWPKLIRSYAAEALTERSSFARTPKGDGSWNRVERPDMKDAQSYLDDFSARHETEESEPGVFRRTELTGADFTAFALTSLLPGTGYDIHIAKMAG